ncbi:MAG TPA: SDR family oxidoreductase [Candidatus Angelobacter sp.]|nr:SDR family oxidoreductase [Candidatus Angelobacter sp.]
MSVYLVTGAAGFIGSSLARELLRRGERVRGIDNFETGKRENIADMAGRLDFREVSILDYHGLLEATEGVECIFHQAALPSVPLSVADPVRANNININGTLNVLQAARNSRVKRVVYAASSSAYGETPTLPKREDMFPSPVSPYAVQKLTGEYYMQSFTKVYGLETVSLRYFNIFGPHQDPTSPYSGVIAKFITQMLEGEPPTIFGDGEQSRDFTYVDNAVQANILAASAPAETVVGKCFNIGTGRRISLNLVFQTLCEILDFRGAVKYATARVGDVKHSLADITRAKEALGYLPAIDFEEGLRRTVEWYKLQSPVTSAPARSGIMA